MIFFHHQLMPTDKELRLYLVENPVPFENYEDHEAAIHMRLHELVEQALLDKENPIDLIEQYLQVDYNAGPTAEEITWFLIETDQVKTVLYTLRDHWHHLDNSIPGSSLIYGGDGEAEANAARVHLDTTLRSYLETLAETYGR